MVSVARAQDPGLASALHELLGAAAGAAWRCSSLLLILLFSSHLLLLLKTYWPAARLSAQINGLSLGLSNAID